MLCVECGKREAKYEGLCEVCFLRKVKFTSLPQHMEVVKCPHCGAIKFKGEWKRLSEEDMLRELIMRNLETLHEYDSINFDFEIREYEGDIELHTIFHIKYKELDVKEEHYSIIHIKYESCPRCNRYFGNYFEAILQIRGTRENELERVVQYAHERLEHYARKNENLFITKEEGKHGGWDIYISDKKEAKKVAEELCRKYGAVLKESPSIVGRKDGKDVYRMTYSVRLPEYRVGDVIEIDGEYYSIEHISGHYVKGISLKDGREKTFDSRRHSINLIKKNGEIENAIVIFPKENEVQILDKDYKTIVAISTKKLKAGENVKIVRIDGNVYVVP